MIDLGPLVASAKRVEGENLVSLVLFGSHARDEAREDSDVDVLVVVGEARAGFDRAAHLRWALLEDRVYLPASFLVVTRDELDADVPAIFLDLALDGRILFDRDFAGPRFERLRALTEAAGLHRVKLGPGHFSWQWTRPPRGDWTLDWDGYRERAA